jgi:hypothetical protein
MTRRRLQSLFIAVALLTGCGNREVITNRAPFQNLLCRPSDLDELKRKSATFAKAERFRYGDAEYAVLLTNERLNFILTQHPSSGQVYATAIARSEPTVKDGMLFRRFLSDLNLKCMPAPGYMSAFHPKQTFQ